MRRLLTVLALALPTMTGCGSEGLSVKGRVTYDGKPVDRGLITFVPAAKGSLAVDAEIVDGGYEVLSDSALLPGAYKVWIDAERPTGRRYPADEGSSEMVEEVVNYIPEQYNTATTLEVDLQADRSDLDFSLEAVGSRPGR